MRSPVWFVVVALVFATELFAADFASKGGPEPANIEAMAAFERIPSIWSY
jgi:hypothetical protein